MCFRHSQLVVHALQVYDPHLERSCTEVYLYVVFRQAANTFKLNYYFNPFGSRLEEDVFAYFTIISVVSLDLLLFVIKVIALPVSQDVFCPCILAELAWHRSSNSKIHVDDCFLFRYGLFKESVDIGHISIMNDVNTLASFDDFFLYINILDIDVHLTTI